MSNRVFTLHVGNANELRDKDESDIYYICLHPKYIYYIIKVPIQSSERVGTPTPISVCFPLVSHILALPNQINSLPKTASSRRGDFDLVGHDPTILVVTSSGMIIAPVS